MAKIEQKTIELPQEKDAKLAIKRRWQSEGWRIMTMTDDFIVIERDIPDTTEAVPTRGGLKQLLD